MSTERRFNDETEYWIQQLFEAWDDVFATGGWTSVDALALVKNIDLENEYSYHIAETWESIEQPT